MKIFKTSLFLFLSFCFISLSAQVRRYEYKYDYQTDSTNAESKSSDIMALFVSNDATLFRSATKEKNDSIMKASIEKSIKAGGMGSNMEIKVNGKNNAVRDIVKSTTKNGKKETYWVKNIGTNRFDIKIERQPVWKLHPETETHQGYKIQKATTTFGGRDWTVWFTPDIAESEGPFLLKGLPGLVVKASDSKGYYTLELLRIKQVDAMPEASQKNEFFGGSTIEASEKQFQKAWKIHMDDPSREFRTFMSNNSRANNGEKVIIKSNATFNGKPIDPKEMEERLKKNLQKNNNYLDLELYNGTSNKK